MGYNASNIFMLNFGVNGTPTTTRFIMPGFAADQANEVRLTLPCACQLSEMRAYCNVAAPGGIVVDTYTAYLNGVATAAAVTVTGAAVTGTWSGNVAFAAGSEVSLYFTTDGATAADDVTITLLFQILE